MNAYESLSVILISLVVSGLAFLGIFLLHRGRIQTISDLSLSKELILKEQITNLSTLLNDERSEKKDLLNRLMSEDLRTFSTLSHQAGSAVPFSPYQGKSDQDEIQQLAEQKKGNPSAYLDTEGVGDPYYDDVELGAIEQLANGQWPNESGV